MLLAASNPSLKRGPHFAVVVAVVHLSHVYFSENLAIDPGPQIVSKSAVVLYVITVQYASLFQLVECGDDLLKGAIDAGPCLVNVGFYLLQFHLVCFHCMCPIGNHVTQRIQAFSVNGKRGYLHPARQKITKTQETKRLDSELYGRAYRHRKSAYFQSGNRKERSGVARSGNTGRQLWGVIVQTLEQALSRHIFTG